jgi:hypothetical protein
MLLLLRQLVFYREILVFLQLTEMAYMEQNEPFSTLNILFCRKYFFQNLTIFTKVNNMVDASASNSNGFLSRDTCVSSTELNRPNCNKVSLSPHLIEPKWQEVFLSKPDSVFPQKQCARFCSF